MQLRLLPLLCAVSVLLGTTRPAFADEDEEELRPKDKGHKVSLTFAPLMLTASVFEVMGEIKLAKKLTIAGIAGYGRPSGVSFWELGAQVRYYPIGGFEHGLNLGAETLLVGASASSGSVTAAAAGLGLGGFIGYKFAASFGLTFDIHGGYRVMGIGASASDSDTGATASTSTGAQGGVLLRLNAGWSF